MAVLVVILCFLQLRLLVAAVVEVEMLGPLVVLVVAVLIIQLLAVLEHLDKEITVALGNCIRGEAGAVLVLLGLLHPVVILQVVLVVLEQHHQLLVHQ